MKLAGDLACQHRCYLQTLKTKILNCVEASKEHSAWTKAAVVPEGEKDVKWHVIQTQDTVLFPEGGGQPFDTGFINDAFCGNVQRKGMEVYHLINKPIAPDTEVEMKIDWPRRIDHMQQHTGQHLLTSIVERELNLETMCWGMGKDTSYIQLPVAKLSEEQIQKVEDICNEYIRNSTAVDITNRTKEESNDSTRTTKTVPTDAGSGTIRFVNLHGIDDSTCCGTHVSNLAQLQLLKLLHFEPKGNTLRLFFVFGNRAIQLLHGTYFRERALVKTVGTHAEDLNNGVTRMKKTAAALKKQHAEALKDLAVELAESLSKNIPDCGRVVLHRDDADMPFMMTIADKIMEANPSSIAVLTQGDRKSGSEGQILLASSSEERLSKAIEQATTVLSAKGGLNKGKWRGKIPSLKPLKDFEKLEL
eukprot:TRINITY_DN593_c1_g1_i1.p1 TRINITY_DN593_c1_g1~~TRINITY_DN593_c1_g1_i1.p1  ORF type:complete len:418 (+),score=86.11 TRINITY_DN593_c1_g1_i1:157-1410(+)